METLNDEIKQKTVSRGRSLEDALAAAHKFWDIYNELMTGFRDIQDCINSQDSPQVCVCGRRGANVTTWLVQYGLSALL